MNSKKGFTLIELLAVIVILAVVMLIGVTAVLPLIGKAQKNSLVSEGLALVETGKTAFNTEQFSTSELKLSSNESYCFSLDWLREHNYYEKESNKYSGSVLVHSKGAGKYDYYFWLTNGNYHISGGTIDYYTVEDGPGDDEIKNCGGESFTPPEDNNNSNESNNSNLPSFSGTGIVYNRRDVESSNGSNVSSLGAYITDFNRIKTGIYTKHYVENFIIQESYACIKAYDQEFCFDAEYYEESPSYTMNKLQSDFNNIFGSYATASCRAYSAYGECFLSIDNNRLGGDAQVGGVANAGWVDGGCCTVTRSGRFWCDGWLGNP